ncbi:MAG: glutathione S-transferase N-terminal domain-containing protein [Pseudomonadales bacterium]
MNTLSSMLATFVRPAVGISTSPAQLKPKKTLELYDMEGCPFCRLTREALTELDISAMIYPCPKNGERFRPKVIEMGGKAQFPFLVDPNTGAQMYESVDTIEYLFKTYGKRPVPIKWQLSALQKIGSAFASALRPASGTRVKPSRLPAKPLELYSFESSPFARPVRELLTEMEIPYLLHSSGRESWQDWLPPSLREKMGIELESTLESRIELKKRAGTVSIPYLVDPNTGVEMAESSDIISYLKTTYAV